jgi:hypothetical protein
MTTIPAAEAGRDGRSHLCERTLTAGNGNGRLIEEGH